MVNKKIQIAPFVANISAPFQTYLFHLVQYHVAMMSGDRTLAHDMREALYAPLEELTPDEVDWLDGVSGDLYLLHGEEVFLPSDLTEPEKLNELKAAQDQGDGEAMLRLIRQCSVASNVFRAHFRAIAYRFLGFPNLSLAFRFYANANVKRDSYSILLLNDLWNFKEAKLAEDYALKLLDAPSSQVRLFSAMILFQCANTLPSKEKAILVSQCIKATEQIEASVDFEKFSRSDKVSLFVLLGICYSYLDDMDQSRQAYDKGLAISPNEEFLLLLRGSLLFATGSTLAADDFRKAVRRKTMAPFPYLVLARDAMIEGNFQQGLKLSKSCFALSDNNRMRAIAMEFIAISSYKLGRPLKDVIRRFDHALELDPSNLDIVQNREAVLRDAEENFANPTLSTGATPRHLSQFDILDLKDVGKDTVSESIINYINKIPLLGKEMRTKMDDLEIPFATAA